MASDEGRWLVGLWLMLRLAAEIWLVIGCISGVLIAVVTRSWWSGLALVPWAFVQGAELAVGVRVRRLLECESREGPR